MERFFTVFTGGAPESDAIAVTLLTWAIEKCGDELPTAHRVSAKTGNTMIEADVRTVAGWLGHNDNGSLLLKVYSHVRQLHEAEMIRKVRFAPASIAAAVST